MIKKQTLKKVLKANIYAIVVIFIVSIIKYTFDVSHTIHETIIIIILIDLYILKLELLEQKKEMN